MMSMNLKKSNGENHLFNILNCLVFKKYYYYYYDHYYYYWYLLCERQSMQIWKNMQTADKHSFRALN